MALQKRSDFVLVLNFKYGITLGRKIKVLHVETVKLKLNQEIAKKITLPRNVVKNVTKEDDMQTFELSTDSKDIVVHFNGEYAEDEKLIELVGQTDNTKNNVQQNLQSNTDVNDSTTAIAATVDATNNDKVQEHEQEQQKEGEEESKKKIKGSRKTKKLKKKSKTNSNSQKNSPKKPRHSFDDDGAFSDSDHEEEFYYTEIEDDEGKAPSPPSPPTLSHRDMARPPHEDPEYQRQIVGNFRQGLLALSQSATAKTIPHNVNNAGPINIPTSPLAHHNYTWHTPVSPVKHARWSPRPSTSSAPYPSPTYIHHHYNNNNSNNNNNNNNNNNHHHQPQPPQQAGLTISQNAANLSTLSHSAPTSSSILAVAPATTVTVNQNMHHQQQQQQQQQQPQQHGAQHLPTPQQQHHLQTTVQAVATANHRSPQSPNRRTRGDNKKCRKVYGMDHKDQWCTQCKWKKACSRFGD